MNLIPAIDLRDGQVVRLRQGDFDQTRRFDVTPLNLARRYAEAGARWLHVVDLDGARAGRPMHTALLADLARLDLSVQWGGGVRSRADVDTLIVHGAQRVVVGSVAARAPALFTEWLDVLGSERLCLALDLRPAAAADEVVPAAVDSRPLGGRWQIAVDAWRSGSGTAPDVLLDAFRTAGLRHVLCTDISRDGVARGPNLELYRQLVTHWPDLQWIASGGVRDEADLDALAGTGVAACVAGTALLDGSLPLSAIGGGMAV